YSISTFWPSLYPAWLNPWRNACSRVAYTSGDALLRNPITGIDCCARAVQGQAATPPRSVMNSRRLTRSPRSTRMPEYQMADPSAKAIAASQSAEARTVGYGSSADERTAAQPRQIATAYPSDAMGRAAMTSRPSANY